MNKTNIAEQIQHFANKDVGADLIWIILTFTSLDYKSKKVFEYYTVIFFEKNISSESEHYGDFFLPYTGSEIHIFVLRIFESA